jgi:hypothetical protein
MCELASCLGNKPLRACVVSRQQGGKSGNGLLSQKLALSAQLACPPHTQTHSLTRLYAGKLAP